MIQWSTDKTPIMSKDPFRWCDLHSLEVIARALCVAVDRLTPEQRRLSSAETAGCDYQHDSYEATLQRLAVEAQSKRNVRRLQAGQQAAKARIRDMDWQLGEKGARSGVLSTFDLNRE